MEKCWNDDRELRPTFRELRTEFNDLISHDEEYNYLVLGSVPEETNSSENLEPNHDQQHCIQ